MKTLTKYAKESMAMFISILILNFALINQLSYAESAREVCERPIFKLWKSQQKNRLWEPSGDTLSSEQAGTVFIYNCFTESEIDDFFANQGNRIENAHFYPILSNKTTSESEGNTDDDDDEC